VKFRKGAWVHVPKTFSDIDFEKAAKDLVDIGFNEVYLIVSSGQGTLYPSKIRLQSPDFKDRDVISPFIRELKKAGLKVHAWIVSLNLHNEDFARSHRDWYVVNKEGVSCVDSPPYVNHYKWLCPTREEVRENLKSLFLEIAEKFDVDGLHFDYIRIPDILLPKALRKNTKVCQKKMFFSRASITVTVKYVERSLWTSTA